MPGHEGPADQAIQVRLPAASGPPTPGGGREGGREAPAAPPPRVPPNRASPLLGCLPSGPPSRRGFGFVTFMDQAGVDKVLAQSRHELDSKTVSGFSLAVGLWLCVGEASLRASAVGLSTPEEGTAIGWLDRQNFLLFAQQS